MTSRGCPFTCSYCCNNIFMKIYHGKGKYVRRRSVDNVIEELAGAKERYENLKMIFFHDDVFTINHKWIKEFSSKYKEHFTTKFGCYCHPEVVNEEIIGMLSYAGLGGVIMGIQSGCESVRAKYYKRRHSNQKILEAARILHKYKITCNYDFILDNPMETHEDKINGLKLVLDLPRPLNIQLVSLRHFPETELTNLLLQKNLISERDVEGNRVDSYERWSTVLDLCRNKENMFWDILYYLADKDFPPHIIESLSRVNFIKRHPKPLMWAMRLISTNRFTVRRNSRIDKKRRNLLLYLQRKRTPMKYLNHMKRAAFRQLSFVLKFFP